MKTFFDKSNLPPGPLGTGEILQGNYQDLLNRQEELLAAANRAPKTCNDDETAKSMTDFCGQMAACIKAAQDAHKVEKEPHLLAADR